MKQMTKQSAIVGVTTLSSLMTVGTAAADTQDFALHQKGDDVKMEEWRTEVARIEAENAQAEADAKTASVTPSKSASTGTTTDTSEKRLAMEERNRKLRHEYHEKYRDYLDAVNEGRKDVVEPTKPVYETMLPDNATESAPSEAFTIVRWDEKPLPNVPQLEFYREVTESSQAPVRTGSSEAPKAKEGLAPASTPEAALTLSDAKEARSEEALETAGEQTSKETVGEAPTPEKAEGADKNLTDAKEQKSKESVGEAPTPEKADGANKHLTDAKEQKSKETKAPTKTSSESSSTYESQKRAYQEAMRQYAEKKSQYDEALKAYTSAKSKYDADLAAYNKILADNAEITKSNQSKQAGYDATYKAYQTAKAEYDAKLTAYNQQVAQNEKAKVAYETAVSNYQAAKKKYDSDSATYQSAMSKYAADKQSYDAKMAEMERNKNIPGHLSQAMSQSLIFTNEPNATVTITGQAHNIKSSSWESADGVLQKFAADRYRSTDYGLQPEAVKNALEGSPDNVSYPVIMNNNSTTTVEYNNLQNTSYKVGRLVR